MSLKIHRYIHFFSNKVLTNPSFSYMTRLSPLNLQVWYINFPPDSQTNSI
jgi:hypothetical protein